MSLTTMSGCFAPRPLAVRPTVAGPSTYQIELAGSSDVGTVLITQTMLCCESTVAPRWLPAVLPDQGRSAQGQITSWVRQHKQERHTVPGTGRLIDLQCMAMFRHISTVCKGCDCDQSSHRTTFVMSLVIVPEITFRLANEDPAFRFPSQAADPCSLQLPAPDAYSA